MLRKIPEKFLQIFILTATILMIVARFLLNEKGRVNPDSIRYMRQANIFPVIDNTTAPLGYPLMIKFFTFFNFDEFWSSKIVAILSYLFIIYFSYKKKFYFRESILLGALFSFVSVFSYTMSEPFILPFVFLFLYYGAEIIDGKIKHWKAIFLLAVLLILMYNIRYSSLFIMMGCAGFGIIFYKKKYARYFLISGVLGVLFMLGYQQFFIKYFNESYYDVFLQIGLHPTSKLLKELFFGLCTTFNPFIHIANPAGGFINYGIYGIGLLNILLIIYLLLKNKLSDKENLFLIFGLSGIFGSFFIQYFYSVNPIDYRLLAPFSFPIWLLYFKKLHSNFGNFPYGIATLSLLVGFTFTMLSRGNYLENRKQMKNFLVKEKLIDQPLKFYMKDELLDLSSMQLAELISTINPVIYVTFKPKDSLQKSTLTNYKIRSKIKLDENKYQ
ncbi:hypothetical protein [Frigoriflavimonas asaccharolytica]|uniref:Uncharacterized protein n=1 Tax=Frigoriflavimonas asaccharolytica TaxID=2735899 RepID=A0A8J8K867_9FLAO|nr:hypothetical protein [Frigoriflavimonas asaccharolytica]NRS91637.1 hypothetical protein [Frigoriflavimonas asaccharolytica]